MKNPFLNTRFLMSETDYRRLPPSEAEVTFVGRSNAGKSSLICALCENFKLARVSKTPGRTRELNVFEVQRGRWLVDVPGFGYAAAGKRERDYWPTMIGSYIRNRPQLATVFVLVDAELGFTDLDLSLLTWLSEQKVNCRVVGCKVDRLSHGRQIEQRRKIANTIALEPEDIFWVSAKKGYGINELRKEVAASLNKE